MTDRLFPIEVDPESIAAKAPRVKFYCLVNNFIVFAVGARNNARHLIVQQHKASIGAAYSLAAMSAI